MSPSYLEQLIALRDLLKSKSQYSVQDARDFLYELWVKHNEDPEFCEVVEQVFGETPTLFQEFKEICQKEQEPYIENKNTVLEEIIVEKPLQSLELTTPHENVKKNVLTEESKIVIEKESKKMGLHAPRIFISYSHKDETFKDELVKMLLPLQTEGVLELWQDRLIRPGDDWFQEIQTAMNACDIALLLISVDFLASTFIQNEEFPNLIKRRKAEGLRVIPIIVKACKWQSVSILKDLQALPKDGKPVVSFGGPGKRDKAWTEIATEIEKFC